MPFQFLSSKRPLVFAHRGGAAIAPENTLAAFDQALALGADGLELDVHLSLDGLVVVHHDRTLERTTDLHGPIADRRAEELARADAGYSHRRGDTFPFRGCGYGVPTLADVLGRYRGVPMIIELKENRIELAHATIDAVRTAGAVDSVCLGCFARQVLQTVRALEPAIATSAAREEVRWALYRSWLGWPVSRVPYQGYQVPERLGRTRVVSPRFVEASHGAQLAVQVWGINTEQDARRLLGWSVDALITDRPDVMVPLVRVRGSGF